ncbi:ribonuclease P protein subunit p29 isoform X1 [Tachysurus vachellii]|uniref:ribonuclease P protein subunit p29 isoform X1 n=1 Tax=Tachysurus vachellii TaxID=175792 RepID=UPI00296AA6DC|nr:ribonuclease P protein subunit p29 isoform X1 [Tachysurus vachellii]
MENLVLFRLQHEESKLLGVQSQHGETAEKFTRAFLKSSAPRLSCREAEDALQRKAVMLHYAREKKKRGTKTKAKGLNAKERRALRVFKLKPEHQKYDLFLPLHGLWKQYITELCNGLRPDNNPQVMQQKLLKADFHGAVLTVVRSKCPSYVGSTGILVQELKHVFKIITKENRLKASSSFVPVRDQQKNSRPEAPLTCKEAPDHHSGLWRGNPLGNSLWNSSSWSFRPWKKFVCDSETQFSYLFSVL